MDAEMKNYLLDLICFIQDKYNESIPNNEDHGNERQFKNGSNIAYYDVWDLIESQLKSFGYDVEELQPITLNPGTKLVR